MAFPDDLTLEQLLKWSPFTTKPPANDDERRERGGRQFRVYFIADVERKLQEIGKNPESVESKEAARILRRRVEELRAIMLHQEFEYLVQDHAVWIERLLDETRDLFD